MDTKKCCTCRQSFSSDEFGPHKGYCRDCYNAWRREWRRKNPDKIKAAIERRDARHPGIQGAYERRSYLKHREKRIAKSRRWNVENKEKFAAREAARRAAQGRATPAWADCGAIEALYMLASELTTNTGVLHHVDHIVPLQSDLVNGLHVESNLRVLTAFENMSKSNRRWPDMP